MGWLPRARPPPLARAAAHAVELPLRARGERLRAPHNSRGAELSIAHQVADAETPVELDAVTADHARALREAAAESEGEIPRVPAAVRDEELPRRGVAVDGPTQRPVVALEVTPLREPRPEPEDVQLVVESDRQRRQPRQQQPHPIHIARDLAHQ